MSGLVSRSAPHDTIQELEAASSDRFWDGLACALDGREFGACYLLGYTIEMLLKTAYFRFQAIPMTEALRAHLQGVGGMPRFRRRRVNLHDIEAWTEQLLETRQSVGRPLDPLLAAELLFRAAEIALHWKETMRYRRAIAASDEVAQLHQHAEWLLDHHRTLWE